MDTFKRRYYSHILQLCGYNFDCRVKENTIKRSDYREDDGVVAAQEVAFVRRLLLYERLDLENLMVRQEEDPVAWGKLEA